jgi:hypothetical protein
MWIKVERRETGVPPLIGLVEHMFLGQYQHSIDEKGRLTVPARYREQLAAEGAYITMGFDHNLMLLTVPGFKKVVIFSGRTGYCRPGRQDPGPAILKRYH